MTKPNKEIQINFRGKCRACGQKMKVICPWEEDKRCGLRQQIYPQHEEFDFPIHSSKSHGFSLLELLICVAIVGILAAIAHVSYQPFMDKVNALRGLWPH